MKPVLLDSQRNKWPYLLGLVATIALGLATRDSNIDWPLFVSVHAGDALWSVALYLAIVWLFPRLPALPIFVATLGISFGVELSQLLSWPWLSALRETLVGRLLLGTGFQWMDFPRYTSGALIAFLADVAYIAFAKESWH